MSKQDLIEIYDHLMKISVKGPDVEQMYVALSKLARLINTYPEPKEVPDEISDSE